MENKNEKVFDEKFDRYLSDSDEVELAKTLESLGGKYMSSIESGRELNNNPVKSKRAFLWRPIAAAAAVILLLSAIYLIPKMTEKDVFAEQFSPYQLVLTERGITDNSDELNMLIADAVIAYKSKRFEESFEAFSQLERQIPGAELYVFYKGISALALEDYEAAIQSLEPIAKDESIRIQEQARWYLLLAFHQNGDAAKTDSLSQLIQAGDYNYTLVERYFNN